ncbi:MAG: hypothetical protein Q8P22_00250 [Chloroflexota bacterium]|nr:hypothetical protein [Chloroflexota bacterium]
MLSDGVGQPALERPFDSAQDRPQRADEAGRLAGGSAVLAIPVASRQVPHLVRLRAWGGVATRLVYAVGAVLLFVLALEVLKRGAGGIKPFLDGISAEGTVNLLGLGWIGPYLVMSGSPVAAIALSLFAGGTISDTEAFAMINGTRLGASFIVLFVGFLYYVGRRRTADGLYIGAVALLTAFTIWLPVLPLGTLVLRQGWFDGLSLAPPGAFTSVVDVVYDPAVGLAADHLPRLLMFVLGVGLLLTSFWVFDRVLPNLEQPSLRFERVSNLLHHPLSMFGLGLLITALTLSVSISLTLLVPLSLKGYVRRESIIPYVMGANISTWVDTLLAALLLNSPRASTIVITEMALGSLVSLTVLLLFYRPYSRLILALAHAATRSRRAFALFLGAIFVVPLALLLS